MPATSDDVTVDDVAWVFHPDRAAWTERRFSREEAAAWITAGFSSESAWRWRPVTRNADTAAAWRDTGFSLLEASDWVSSFDNVGMTVTADVAARWRFWRFGPVLAAHETIRVRRSCPTWGPADVATEWDTSGVDETVRAEGWNDVPVGLPDVVAWRTVRPDVNPWKAYEWHEAGFSPAESEAWDTAGWGDEPEQTARWRNAGVAPEDVDAWADAGYTPEQAQWRIRRGWHTPE